MLMLLSTLAPIHSAQREGLLSQDASDEVKYHCYVCVCVWMCVYVCMCVCVWVIDIKKVDKLLTHAMHVKDRYLNGTFIDKLIK